MKTKKKTKRYRNILGVAFVFAMAFFGLAATGTLNPVYAGEFDFDAPEFTVVTPAAGQKAQPGDIVEVKVKTSVPENFRDSGVQTSLEVFNNVISDRLEVTGDDGELLGGEFTLDSGRTVALDDRYYYALERQIYAYLRQADVQDGDLGKPVELLLRFRVKEDITDFRNITESFLVTYFRGANKESKRSNTADIQLEPGTNLSLPVVKAWSLPNGGGEADTSETSVTVELVKDGTPTGKTITLKKSGNWTGKFLNLESGHEYTVRESKVPSGWEVSYVSGPTSYSVVNTKRVTPTSIPVVKSWSLPDGSASDVKPEVTIGLYRGDELINWEVLGGNNHPDYHVFTIDHFGNTLMGEFDDYTVKELFGNVAIGEGSDCTIDGKWFLESITKGENCGISDGKDAYYVLNTSKPEVKQVTSIPAVKFWSGPDGKAAPESAYSDETIRIGLFKDGTQIGATQILSQANNWTYVFPDMPGQFSDYEVFELDEEENPIDKDGDVNEKWTFTGSAVNYSNPIGNYYALTNTSKPLTSVPVYKSWSNPDGTEATKHPASVTVKLMKGDQQIGDEQVLNEDNGWHYEFTDLEGKASDYTVVETDLNKKVWSPEVKTEGNTKYIINTKKDPEKINIPVEKKWENTPESDKVEVTIKLLANGEPTDKTVTLNADNGWKAEFINLPKTDDEGEDIEYTIEEVSVGDEFTTETTGDAKKGFTVTNTKKPDEPEIDKKVNGSTHADLAKVDEEFTYTISSKVPNYQADEFIIVDELEPVLEYIKDSAVVTIGGTAIEDVPFEVDDNTLTWDLKEYCAAHMSEKVEITFKAKIVDGADLTSYIDDNGSLKVPNEATLKLNNESHASDKVTVTPPPDKPDIEKTVTTSKTKNSNSTADAKKNEVFTYNVDTKIPLNMKSMKVIDVMGEALEYVKGSSVVTIGGEKIDLQPKVSGKQLTWDLSSYKKYATKAVHITYKAKFADDATPIQMETGVANSIGLDINGDRIPGNSVTVKTTPQDKKTPSNPGLEKFVTTEKTGKNNRHGDLAAEDEIFTYTLESSVPKNASRFIIGDELEPVLSYISDSAEVLIDGMVATDVEPKVKGNKITFDLSAYCASAAGKSVSISFDATIRSGAKLSDYMVDGKVQIPNRATYQVDDKMFESNQVTVTPPGRTSGKDKGSKTGDPTMPGLLAVMLLAAAGGALVAVRRRKKTVQ